ncbi:MAG: DUF1194 domain-containing protein [Rhodobacteraceae bacterium]|nr:DUF1194 domain-containing protein [Paracoccaceae bacterium]
MIGGILTLACLSAGPARACDIALALAVDVSGSVDQAEYRLQMQGLASALADPVIGDALIAAKAQVMVVQWTGDNRQHVSVPWTSITDRDRVAELAAGIAAAPRRWWQFSTAIGAALGFTKAQFGAVSTCRRKVIDVSGDGRSNEGPPPGSFAREMWQDGFTVNGLAIEGSEPDLTTYYWENVALGDGAFVITANGFGEYHARMRLKLLREVTEQVSRAGPDQVPAQN